MKRKTLSKAELLAAIQAQRPSSKAPNVVCETYLSEESRRVGNFLRAIAQQAKGAPLPSNLLPPMP
jgi:hypothetical protein